MCPVETLKSKSKYYAAGVMAATLQHSCNYGCHYGMRSTRAAAIAEFYRGYNDAIDAMGGK